jgi:pyrroloquinoline-quinone synthase
VTKIIDAPVAHSEPGSRSSGFERRLLEVLAAKSLLQHPFYRAWTAGTLEVERLQEYARQYFHFEAAFPRFLSAIHARTEPAGVRQMLLENLWDEEYGPRNHRALWLEFAEAVGVPAAEVEASTPNEETTALVEHFSRVCREAPVAEALATLYAYEGQVPQVAWQKITGLRDNYGLKPAQFEFFSVHLVADVAHADTEMKAIAETIGAGSSEESVVAAAGAACDRLLSFLDGCY